MTARSANKRDCPAIQYRNVTRADERRDRAAERVDAVLMDIVNYEMPEKKRRALKAMIRLRRAVDDLEGVLERM